MREAATSAPDLAQLSREASYEVASIATAMLRLANAAAAGGAPIDEHLARGLAVRLRTLADCWIDMNDWPDRTPTACQLADVATAVFGEWRQADDEGGE